MTRPTEEQMVCDHLTTLASLREGDEEAERLWKLFFSIILRPMKVQLDLEILHSFYLLLLLPVLRSFCHCKSY